MTPLRMNDNTIFQACLAHPPHRLYFSQTSGPDSSVLGNIWGGLWHPLVPSQSCPDRIDDECVRLARQGWLWTDGSSVESFHHWVYGQPDGESQCGRMVVNGNWRDIRCTVQQPFICEMPVSGM